jgi:hypothetical protein
MAICTEHPSAPSDALKKAPVKGMVLSKEQKKTDQFIKSLEAEGEVILEDTQLSAIQSRSSSSIPPSDPITVTIEEKLNATVKMDGGVSNFYIQGTLALQVLNVVDGFLQLQVLSILILNHSHYPKTSVWNIQTIELQSVNSVLM